MPVSEGILERRGERSGDRDEERWGRGLLRDGEFAVEEGLCWGVDGDDEDAWLVWYGGGAYGGYGFD